MVESLHKKEQNHILNRQSNQRLKQRSMDLKNADRNDVDQALAVISLALEYMDSITEQEGKRRHRGIDELLHKEEELDAAGKRY